MKSSVYMTWAKHHAAARYNLANSGVVGCDLSNLELQPGDVAVNGPNFEGYLPLKQAIAAQYGVQAENVVPVQGTSMANFLAMASVVERGDSVLVEQPAYEPILAALAFLGADVRRFSRRFENGYQIDVDELRRSVTPKTRLIVVTSPHNPSGVAIGLESLKRIGEIAASVGARVLVDEAYRDILFEDAEACACTLGPQFITTASLTKVYGLSGLRCGWVLCEPELAEAMRRLHDLFGAIASIPSDTLGVSAFRQLAKLAARTRAIVEPNTRLVHQFLSDHREWLDCVIPSRSMIVFPRLKKLADSQPLHDLLRQFETSIVPGKFFENPGHFRLGFAIRTEDVKAGLSNVSKALRTLPTR